MHVCIMYVCMHLSFSKHIMASFSEGWWEDMVTYWLVELESPATGFDGNTNWLICHSFLQGSLIVLWNIFISINGHNPSIFLKEGNILQWIRIILQPHGHVHEHNTLSGNLKNFHSSRKFGEGTNPVRITGCISRPVRVIFFAINATIVDDEFKSIVHETSIASLVVWLITIHQLLLW